MKQKDMLNLMENDITHMIKIAGIFRRKNTVRLIKTLMHSGRSMSGLEVKKMSGMSLAYISQAAAALREQEVLSITPGPRNTSWYTLDQFVLENVLSKMQILINELNFDE